MRAVVVHFFRGATERVDDVLAAQRRPPERLAAYLRAVAAELAPASSAFLEDVAAFAPAAEVYERSTLAGLIMQTGLIMQSGRSAQTSSVGRAMTSTRAPRR